MSVIPKIDFTTAVVQIAVKDPDLGVALIHLHECIEDAKNEAAGLRGVVDALVAKFDGWTRFAGTTLLAICGTLVAAVCGIAWEILLHGGLRP